MRDETTVEVTLNFSNGGRLTPEDLALIEAIRKDRSIIGAGRATGVSYRKCWLMVDALNRTFETPVFATYPGRKEAGSEFTSFGERLVALYESMNRRSRSGAAAAMKELRGALNPELSTTGQRRGVGRAEGCTATSAIATVLIIAQARRPGSSASRSTDSVVTSACSRRRAEIEASHAHKGSSSGSISTIVPGRRLVIETSIGRDSAIDTSRASMMTLTPEVQRRRRRSARAVRHRRRTASTARSARSCRTIRAASLVVTAALFEAAFVESVVMLALSARLA